MAQNPLKGNISLTIDELELAAQVTFTPDANGAEWTAEKLSRMFLDNRLNQVNSRVCDELLKNFSKSKGAVTETVAKGIAPEDPAPETVDWSELPIPDSFKILSGEILAKAPPPVLFRVRTEKIKVEQTVKKPSAFPFVPAKEETVVTWEKKEIREKIRVDGKHLKTGYARKGDILGTVSPPKQGKQGKTIFGKPLTVPVLETTQFGTGLGVTRIRNQLVSEVDGFVRIGPNWVDIIPFADHAWVVRQAEDGQGLLLDYSPGNPAIPIPDPKEIMAKAIELGAKEPLIVEEETLRSALKASCLKQEPLPCFKLCRDADAEIILTVAPDKTLATLTLKKGRGNGKPLDFKEVTDLLQSCKYRGMDMAGIKAAITAFREGPVPFLENLVLAQGTPATRGTGRELAVALEFLTEEKSAEIRNRLLGNPALLVGLETLEEFKIADAERIAFVKKDEAIATLTKPEPGKNGIDISGATIPGLPGNDPAIRTLENVRMNQGILVSEVSGIVLYREREGSHLIRALPYRDSEIDIEITGDGMKAAISLRKAIGAGIPLTPERVMGAVKAKGITYGVMPKILLEAGKAALAGKVILKVPFAFGRPAVPQGGASVDFKVEFAAKNDSGRSARTCAVSKGQAFAAMRVTGAGGEGGTDVLGNRIEPPPGTVAQPLAIGEGIEKKQEADGSVMLVASAAGVLTVTPAAISVQSQYRVPSDVGPGTGNVKFPGTVRVEGSVKSGFMVVSGGDMLIRGTVEAAILSSNGKIVAAQGIRGERKATLHANRTIETTFAEQATLLAVEDIRIQGPCGMCFVKTNGKVALIGPKGTLVGGLVRAKRGVVVQDLGSARGVKTEVSFGQDYLVQDQIETEDREIEKIKHALVELDSKIRQAHKIGASIADLGAHKVKLVKLMEKRSIRSFTLKEKYEEHFPSEIVVRGTIFPGVILESHNRLYEVRQLRTGVKFSFDRANGRIVEMPIQP